MDAFSRTALATFSPVWKKKLDINPEFLVLDGPYLGVYKLILDWIKLCIEEGNDVKFPDVSFLPQEPALLHFPSAFKCHRRTRTLEAKRNDQIEETETKLKEDVQEYERPHQLHVLLQVIAAANYLQIPEGSLQNGLKKVITSMSSVSLRIRLPVLAARPRNRPQAHH